MAGPSPTFVEVCGGDSPAQPMDPRRPHARAHASHHVAASGIRSKTVDLAERSQNSERLQWQAPRRGLWWSVGEIAERSLWTPAGLRGPHASHLVAASGIRSKTVDLAERSQNSERFQWQAPRRGLWWSVGEIAQRSLWTPADLRGPQAKIMNLFNSRPSPKLAQRASVTPRRTAG
jgi:hypothetical protein